jgi:hypothetical protein
MSKPPRLPHDAEIAAEKDGKMKAPRVKTWPIMAHPTPLPSRISAGLFSICTGNYDLRTPSAKLIYTRAEGAGWDRHRCSFRVTEAAYLIEAW